MKSEKGITLISLIIYLVILAIILGVLASISINIFNNLKYAKDTGKDLYQFNNFNMYFIDDVKNNSKIYDLDEEGHKIIFIDGTVYTFENNNIYRNKVKICENIENIRFSSREIEDENNFKKQIITVEMTIKADTIFTSKNEYVLKYW